MYPESHTRTDSFLAEALEEGDQAQRDENRNLIRECRAFLKNGLGTQDQNRQAQKIINELGPKVRKDGQLISTWLSTQSTTSTPLTKLQAESGASSKP